MLEVTKGIADLLDRMLDYFIKFGIVLFITSLTILMMIQIFLRYLMESPFLGIEEMSVLFGLWLYFLSAAYVTRDGRHICGGILTIILREPRHILSVQFSSSVLCFLLSGLCSFLATDYVQTLDGTGRHSAYLGWPTTLWATSLLTGFLLMTVYFGREAVMRWRKLRSFRSYLGGDMR